ncbi:MAG TPA: nucleotide exchange factor GrpE [Pyrinomonadaceae bacterium]|jgi:molecular chaperone GrpE|nr:nucleotide exchange factor GrpE [Pyrinomonadaceae bacterium]
MNRTDRSDKERRGQSARIPVRFVGDEERDEAGRPPEEGNGGEAPQEGASEAEQRAKRPWEQDEPEESAAAPEASGPARAGEDESAAVRNEEETAAEDEAPRSGVGAAGPAVAELVATRAELKRVEFELKKAKEERAEFTDKMARRQAEFDNFRKRTERERSEVYGRALGDVVRRLLPVLDNLQRALDAERTVQTGDSEEFRHFVRGIELISKQLSGALESLGVEIVPTVGERFDPHVHEAVATEETDEFEPDTVMQEMQRGYRLGDKLLRPAMVKVAK